MLENPTDSSSTANDVSTIKRYAPPNQRNRALGRRKSGGGDRLERANSYTNDGDKNQVVASRNVPISDHGDLRSTHSFNENPTPGLIALQGCCNNEAYQLLNNRWVAAVNAYESPLTEFAEKPVMYSGSSASAWGQFRLPHQPQAGVGPSGLQLDFLSELRRAMNNSHASFGK